MSFDIYFVSRGVPFDEAMDLLADAAGSGSAMTPEQVARWDRVESGVRSIVPDAEVFASDTSRELTDLETGLQLCQYGAEISLSVPYWEEGEEAARIVGLLEAVCRSVEEATGLVGYDPQAEQGFLAGGSSVATESFDQVQRMFAGVEPADPPARRRWWRRGR